MEERINTFLSALWHGGACGNYWRSADKLTQWTSTLPIADCALGTSNIYMSVYPTHAPRGEYERTRIADVAVMNCLFSEWDAKDFGGSMAAVREHIKALAVQPQVIVESGGGYHGYWFIDTPMPVTPDGLFYLGPIQAAWVKLTGGDPAAKDLARVLRLPGTLNAKYTPARRVGYARFNLLTAPRYRLADLCALAEPYWAEEPTAQAAVTVPTVEHGQRSGAIAAIVDTLRSAPTGQRNKILHWAACKLFEKGMTPAAVEAELLSVAVGIGLSENESRATMRSAAKQPARPPEPYVPQSRMPTRATSLSGVLDNLSKKYQS